MTINAYGTGAYRAASGPSFVGQRAQFDDLQRQLASKEKSTSYGGLGADRTVSLDLNAKLTTLDSWLDGIQLANTNLKLMSNGVGTFGKLVADARNNMTSNSYLPTASGQTAPQILAADKVKQTLDMLNTSVNGRYLFSGKTSDVEPTATFDQIMNGDGAGRAGVRQLIDERRQADLGSGLGRLTAGGTGANATIAEEATVHPYGFKLAGVTTTGTGLTTALTAGPPANLAVTVAAQPQAGDTLNINLNLPDGTATTITLTARATGTTGPAATGFEIGTDVNATATNLRAAITAALGTEAKTTLSAASSQVAAQDFFAGSASNPPKRVPGPGFATATAPPANTGAAATATVIWYKGDDGADPARSTSTVQVDQGQRVGVGARANEQAFQVGLAQFAIMASETFSASDDTAQARYNAMAARVNDRLGFGGTTQKPAEVLTELGTAQSALDSAKTRHQTTKDYLTTTLGNVQNVTTEDVATQILALQTQLQASYQVTSMLSKLTLTSYL